MAISAGLPRGLIYCSASQESELIAMAGHALVREETVYSYFVLKFLILTELSSPLIVSACLYAKLLIYLFDLARLGTVLKFVARTVSCVNLLYLPKW